MRINWIIENTLGHSRYPYAKDQLEDIYIQGIRAIVSLIKCDIDKVNFIREKGFEYLEVPVKDLTAPTIEQLIRMNKFIDSMINNKMPVLVHCVAGGRSGTVLAGYLIYHGTSFNDALSEVRSKITDAVAINSRPQEEILKELEIYIKTKVRND